VAHLGNRNYDAMIYVSVTLNFDAIRIIGHVCLAPDSVISS